MNQPFTPDSFARVTLTPGMRFGSYEIVHALGAGGMGEVYRAKDTRLGRDVAIKTLSLGQCSDGASLQRFENEARSASALNHPNIVTIYELGQADGICYIAMEFIEGETLRSLIAADPVPFRKVIHIATQVADGLAKAHDAGITHRDLKPENLMVLPDGTAKILDFGLAKLGLPSGGEASEASTVIGLRTQPGVIMGTIGYLSPEQANGWPVDHRSDQFSFGAVLYEMVTGKPAFSGRSMPETLAAILRDEPPRIATMSVQIPAPFLWIVERCLAKDLKDRYVSTRDLARDLAAVRDRLADLPARSAESRPSNLPVQRTAFIGREREVVAVKELLLRQEVRVITLTGPGGIGKSRLALQVAAEVADQFAGGVAFVPLSAVSDPELIASVIAQAIGLRITGNQSPQEVLKDFLQSLDAPMLLLLDNFEHLAAAAPFVAELLSVGPALKVLVTSQAPLHVYGEHEFPVPTLGLPDPRSASSAEAVSRYSAVALFVERAAAVKRGFELTKENAAVVATICARLDGLPLAIELAAARIKMLSPADVQGRLESCLNLLTGGARDLPARHQTLRGTLDWSYGLLTPAEQMLFRRLSVFAGGSTLEGVEAVCDTKADLGIDVLDGMASLVDKSLVQQVDSVDGESRFVMLSTIRQYAAERLMASGDEAPTRRSHAAYCLVFAEEGAENAGDQKWLERLEAEHDNFRAALDWLTSTGNAEWGLRLGAALFPFWEAREYLTEARGHLARLLTLPGTSAHPKSRARVLFAASVLASAQGDYVSARKLGEESLEISRSLGDQHAVAAALNALAVHTRDSGDVESACVLFEKSLATWRETGDQVAIARSLSNLANIVKARGDYAQAHSLYDECLAIFQKLGDETGAAWTLNYQGDVAREQGDYASARARYEQSLATFRRLADAWGVASSQSDLGNLSRDEGKYAESQRLYGESLRSFQELGHKRGIARVLEALASSAAAQSQPQRSLRLAGAAAALRQNLGAPLPPGEQARLEKSLEPAREALGHAAGAAWMQGWAMTVEEAVEEALSDAPAAPQAI